MDLYYCAMDSYYWTTDLAYWTMDLRYEEHIDGIISILIHRVRCLSETIASGL